MPFWEENVDETWHTSREDMQSYLGDGRPVVYVYRGAQERIPVIGEFCWEDARLIVHAVNSHDALVEALRCALAALDEAGNHFDHDNTRSAKEAVGRFFEFYAEDARALLAKAEASR